MVEVPICIALSLRGMEGFAFYLSGSTDVASVTTKMWQVSSPPPSKSLVPGASFDSGAEYRLVLHLLRSQLPAISHPPCHQSALVLVSGAGFKHLVGSPMVHRGDGSQDESGARVDLLLGHLWRITGLLIPGCWSCSLDLGFEARKRKDHIAAVGQGGNIKTDSSVYLRRRDES